jgi:oxygen-independent coproporphyrinogen-3 oxidase
MTNLQSLKKIKIMNQLQASILLKKYDVPTPRYTSYPTVPTWEVETFSNDRWRDAVRRCFDETNDSKGISLYIRI